MLLLINKPAGITSHDAISGVKKKLYTLDTHTEGQKIKIGHAGTLDPMATGLIIAATDKDTKRLHDLTGSDKVYETIIDFSKWSDTRDMDFFKEHGEVEPRRYESIPTREQIDSALKSIHGTPNLPLTPFSARKYKGKKLYQHARAGNLIHMNVPMTVIGHKITDYQFPLVRVELFVGMGTYIRSIGHWLGTQFGGDALLTALKRTRVGAYTLDDMQETTILTGVWDEQKIPFAVIEETK